MTLFICCGVGVSGKFLNGLIWCVMACKKFLVWWVNIKAITNNCFDKDESVIAKVTLCCTGAHGLIWFMTMLVQLGVRNMRCAAALSNKCIKQLIIKLRVDIAHMMSELSLPLYHIQEWGDHDRDGVVSEEIPETTRISFSRQRSSEPNRDVDEDELEPEPEPAIIGGAE